MTMGKDETNMGTCPACGGALKDYDDYVAARAVKIGMAALPAALVICAVWAPLFFIIRLLVGGALGEAAAGALVLLIVKKIIVGLVIGALLAVAVGIGRSDLGLLLGAVIGSIGGFFVAAADIMPLRSDAAHRMDIVIVAVAAGILCALTVKVSESYGCGRFKAWLGPEPREGSCASELK